LEILNLCSNRKRQAVPRLKNPFQSKLLSFSYNLIAASGIAPFEILFLAQNPF